MTTERICCQPNLPLKKRNSNSHEISRQRRKSDQTNFLIRFFCLFIAVAFVCSFFVLPKTWGLQSDADAATMLQQAGGRDFKVPEPIQLYDISFASTHYAQTVHVSSSGFENRTNQTGQKLPDAVADDLVAAYEENSASSISDALTDTPVPASASVQVLSVPDTHFGLNEMFTFEEFASLSEEPTQSGVSEVYGPYGTWSTTANDGKGWVILDAGHGGSDPGSNAGGLYEKDITLEVVLNAARMLEAQGVDLILTREDDQNIPVSERIRLANNVPAAFFISVHCDWFEDPSINGTSTLYSNFGVDAKNGLGERKRELAAIIQAGLAVDLETADRGINKNDNILVLREIKRPAVMVELSFLSNVADRALLQDPSFKHKAALNLVSGVLNALASAPEFSETLYSESADNS